MVWQTCRRNAICRVTELCLLDAAIARVVRLLRVLAMNNSAPSFCAFLYAAQRSAHSCCLFVVSSFTYNATGSGRAYAGPVSGRFIC